MLVSWAQMADTAGATAELEAESPLLASPQDGKTKGPEMADAWGYQKDSRRVHKSFEESCCFHRTHEVEKEKFLPVSVLKTLLLPQAGVIWKVQRHLPRKTKQNNKSNIRQVCMYMYTHKFCTWVHV